MTRFLRVWSPAAGPCRSINVSKVARFDIPIKTPEPGRKHGDNENYADAYDAQGERLGRVDADEVYRLEQGRATFLPDHTGSAYLLYWDFEEGEEISKERWPVVGWLVEPSGGSTQAAFPVTCADLDTENLWWVVEVWHAGKPSVWMRPNDFSVNSLDEAEKHFNEWLSARRGKKT